MSNGNIFGFVSEDTFAAKMDEQNRFLAAIAASGGNSLHPTNWRGVQAIVRAGMADKIFSIGDQFFCNKGNETLVWDVIGFDHDTPANTDLTHSMTLQLHNIYKALQFDAREAFYYCSSALYPGTYHFHVGERADYDDDVDKDFQFTIDSTVPEGAQLVFNALYHTTLEGSTISIFSNRNETTALMTVTLSVGSSGINLGTINTAINGDLNSISRCILSSNNYANSAIRQLLNSREAAGSVWTPKTNWDRPPVWKTTEPGFAYDIDSEFLSVLGLVTKTTALNTVCDGGGVNNTTEMFFLLAREEVFGGRQDSSINEGAAYAYYRNNSVRPTQSGFTGEDPIRIKYLNGTATNWFLRSPNIVSTGQIVYVSGENLTTNNPGVIYTSGTGPTNGYGISPACAIC